MKTAVRHVLEEKGSPVISIRQTHTVHDAIEILVQHNIGSVLVMDQNDKLVGIFTERDILRETARRADQLKTTKVESVMTTDLIIGLPDDDVEYLMGVMTSNKIRHIPIMEGDNVQGMISIGDLVKAMMSRVSFENRYLKDYIMGKYPG